MIEFLFVEECVWWRSRIQWMLWKFVLQILLFSFLVFLDYCNNIAGYIANFVMDSRNSVDVVMDIVVAFSFL